MKNKYNRYLVKYLNKGGHRRETYVEAINSEVAEKAFHVYNDGTVLKITKVN